MGTERKDGNEQQPQRSQIRFTDITRPDLSAELRERSFRCYNLATDEGDYFGFTQISDNDRVLAWPGSVDLGQLGKVADELSQLVNGKKLDLEDRDDRGRVDVVVALSQAN